MNDFIIKLGSAAASSYLDEIVKTSNIRLRPFPGEYAPRAFNPVRTVETPLGKFMQFYNQSGRKIEVRPEAAKRMWNLETGEFMQGPAGLRGTPNVSPNDARRVHNQANRMLGAPGRAMLQEGPGRPAVRYGKPSR